MFCPKCGTKQDDDSRFCHSCGADLSEFLDLDGTVEEVTNLENQDNQIEADSLAKEETVIVSKPIKPKGRDNRDNTEKKSKAFASTPTGFVRPKKKKAITGAVAIALIAVVVAGALFAVRNIIGNISAGSKYVYLSGDKYYYSTNLEKDKDIEIASARVDYNSDNLVRFSPDGKYVYYYTKVEDNKGSLYRAEVDKLKKDPQKNAKFIETIDSNVYVGFDFLGNGSLLYKKGDDILYYYDGNKSVKIDNNVESYYTDKDSKLIYTVGLESGEDEDYSYNTLLYGVDISKPEEKIKMATDVAYIRSHDDFNNIVFVKTDDNGKETIYRGGFDKEAEKIHAGVLLQGNYEEEIVYYTETGENIHLYDFVNDTAKGDDTYDYLREALKSDDFLIPICNLYVYKDGKEETVAENVVGIRYCGDMYAYHTADDVKESLPKVSIEDLWNGNADIDEDYVYGFVSAATYVSMDNPKEKYKLNEKVADEYVSLDEEDDIYPTFYQVGSNWYAMNNESSKLFKVTIENSQISNPSLVAEDGYVTGSDNEKLYFISGSYSNEETSYGDVFAISGDEKQLIAKDVTVYNLALYEDGTLFAYTDYSYYSEEGSGDLAMFNSKGEKTSIGMDVNQFVRKDKNDVLYISDYNLHYFNGKDNAMPIKNGVSHVWCSDCMEKTDTLDPPRGW